MGNTNKNITGEFHNDYKSSIKKSKKSIEGDLKCMNNKDEYDKELLHELLYIYITP